MRLVLDIRKTLEQNAAFYFEKAKKLKAKAKGARETAEKFRNKLTKEEAKAPKTPKKPELKEQTPKHWYEKFRWFLSSEGMLCVGGRDAGTNELIVKKHTDTHDLLCHTEAPGSPFFVIKTEGVKPNKLTIDEALEATASYSRAWKTGIATAEAFCVTPDQVSKEANTGEYIAKGAFMVRGKRESKTVPVKLAIGVLPDKRLMAGPESAIKKHCATTMLIVQGDVKPSDAAKKIQKYLGTGEPDDIIRLLPSGDMKVIGQ